jgi:chemotaxis protein methyltransferase CheR
MRALCSHVLPELLRHAEGNGRRLRIWSAGCSTGEEAYSIAMMVRELVPASEAWDIKILATDVSQRALAAARTARYGARSVMLASPQELARFFMPGPGGTHEVRPEVRELVEFRHHNLVTEPVPFPAREQLDLVLCRNVTIYFARETTRALMGRLHERLREGGYLFLGHSETLWQLSNDFKLVALGEAESAAFVYQRIEAPPERRSAQPVRRTAADLLRTEIRLRPLRLEPPPAPVPPPPRVDVPALLEQARSCLARGDYAAALAAANTALAVEPLRAEAFYLGGLALVNTGEDQAALVHLRKAVYLDAGMGFAHFLLAGVLDRLGDQAAAGREYGAAAATLGAVPADASAPELGGRSVRELAALCRDLEQRFSGRSNGVEGVR